MRRLRALLLVVPLLAGACQGEPTAFAAVDRVAPTGDSLHLTYFLGEDRAPAWRGADTLYYGSGGYDPFPASQGALMAVARQGGAARLVLPELQQSAVFLATPLPTPSGDRVAYVALDALYTFACTGDSAINLATFRRFVGVPFRPPLTGGRLSVRPLSGAADPGTDPRVPIDFTSVQLAPGLPIALADTVTRYLVHEYPFQVDYAAGGALPFRPSWSPDGKRLAYSDGLRALTWTPGDVAGVPLPGSRFAVSAAWSPTGDRIAVSRPIVQDSAILDLLWFIGKERSCADRHISYNVSDRRIVLLRLDGGAALDLGEGEEPAWSPDGTAIYARRPSSNQIWRIPVAGGAATAVAGTTAGHDPAVSPDGQWLAFSRQVTPSNHDLWLVRLSH